jgi:hypothetical protein
MKMHLRKLSGLSALTFALPLVLAASPLALQACSPDTKARPDVAAGPAKLAKSDEAPVADFANPVDHSEALADAGEKILDPNHMPEAFGKFSEAVKLNPENNRAKFWTALLKPMLQLKGIVTRVRPLYAQANPGASATIPIGKGMSPFDTFLRDGPEDIHTAEELGAWMDSFKAAISDARVTIRAIKGSEISIVMPEAFMPTMVLGQGSTHCNETSFGPVQFSGVDDTCGTSNSLQVGLNRADLEALLIGLGAYESYLEVASAYRLNPLAFFQTQHAKVESKADAQVFFKTLLNVKDGGTLRSAKPFEAFKDTSSDIVLGLRYMLENQTSLCPKGHSTFENRNGYLVSMGFCVDQPDPLNPQESQTARTLHGFEMFLAGASTDIVIGGKLIAAISPLKLIDSPIADLKDLAPIKFDDCGRLISLNTKITAQYFTSGSFEDVLAAGARTEKACPTLGGNL